MTDDTSPIDLPTAEAREICEFRGRIVGFDLLKPLDYT